jgi:hypothetical protein
MYREFEVRAGIQLLDTHPAADGWRNKFDPNTLEIQNCYHCVLGQVFGGYGEGLDILGIRGKQVNYGFTLTGVPYTLGGGSEMLEQTWKMLVAETVPTRSKKLVAV